MKLFACFAVVQAGIGDGAKQLTVFDEHVNCVNNSVNPTESIDPSNAENYYAPSWLQGTYSCVGAICQLLTCSNGYQGVPVIPGSAEVMKCKHDRLFEFQLVPDIFYLSVQSRNFPYPSEKVPAI